MRQACNSDKSKTADTLPAVRNRAKTFPAFLMCVICLSRPVTPCPGKPRQERSKTRSGAKTCHDIVLLLHPKTMRQSAF
ncbi:hypothetical protein EAMG_05395 [Escherichia coli M056]|nr:hypothetical protein EAMG_05618 [Escherichia coli M056]OSK13643.1 hypothetical protein EAMG_05395 [Escherichia coli M056]